MPRFWASSRRAIVSNEDATSPPLVAFYERANAAGAPDVVVAREAEPVEADLVAA